ncbi:MAG: hypothetical protein WD825_13385, partial [Gemmatimonadaceae bacterium]
EAERIRNALDRGSIRSLASVASRFGIGDDVCGPLLMKRIPRKDREKLVKRADTLASKVDAWLDTFPKGKMSAEAAAYMYLMSGVDEIR